MVVFVCESPKGAEERNKEDQEEDGKYDEEAAGGEFRRGVNDWDAR